LSPVATARPMPDEQPVISTAFCIDKPAIQVRRIIAAKSLLSHVRSSSVLTYF
jgi:hypothetical protein